MNIYLKPETEIVETEIAYHILAGSGDWDTKDDDPNNPSGIGTGGDDGPAPSNQSTLWDIE